MAKKATAKVSISSAWYKSLTSMAMGNYKALIIRSGGTLARKIANLSSMEEDGPDNPLEVGSDEWLTEVTRLLYGHSRDTFRLLTVTEPPLSSSDAIQEVFSFLGLVKTEDES